MFHTSNMHMPRNRQPSALRTFIASSSFGPPDTKEPLRRGILLTAVAFVMLLIGSILTWLGFNDVFGGGMSMTGPLLIALSLLLLLLSFRQFLLARKRNTTNSRSSMQLDAVNRENGTGVVVNRENGTAVVVNGEDGLHPATIIVDGYNPMGNYNSEHITVHRSWEEDCAPPSYQEVTRFTAQGQRSHVEPHNTPCPPHHPRYPHHHHYQSRYPQDELPPTYEETMVNSLYLPPPPPPPPPLLPSTPTPSLQSQRRSPVGSARGVGGGGGCSRDRGNVSQSNVTVLSPLPPVGGKARALLPGPAHLQEQGWKGEGRSLTPGSNHSTALVALASASGPSQHAPPLPPLLLPPPSQRVSPSPPPPSPLRQLSAPPSPHLFFFPGPPSSPGCAGALGAVSPRASCLQQLSPHPPHALPLTPSSPSPHFSAPSSPRPWAGPPPSPHSHTPPPQYTSCPPSPPVLRQLSAPPSPHPFFSRCSSGFASSPPPVSLNPPLPMVHAPSPSPRSQLQGLHPFPPSSSGTGLMGHPLPSSPHPHPGHTGSSGSVGQEGYACFYSFLPPPPSLLLPLEAPSFPPAHPSLPPAPSPSTFTQYSLMDSDLTPHPRAGFEGVGPGDYPPRAVPGQDVGGGVCGRPEFQGLGEAALFQGSGRGVFAVPSTAQSQSGTDSTAQHPALVSRTDIQASI